jgi:hypothetical protein
MFAKLKQHWVFLALLVSLTGHYLWGVNLVPFHPDESTQLFMSEDFDLAISNPLKMAWAPEEPITTASRYRQLDAPLTRYLLGFGRYLFSLPALKADWEWSATWEDNQQLGAVPDEQLLLVGRFTIASLFPLSLILLYLIGLTLGGRLLGFTIVLIFGINALILLHTRRAMAEGAMVFSLILAFYALINADKRPFIAGLAVALAFSAKQTAIALLPVGLLAACWIPNKYDKKTINNAGLYFVGFLVLTLFMNPFLWRQPINAFNEAVKQRQILLERQVNATGIIAPAQVLHSPSERIAVSIAQLSIAPPVFSEFGNYRENTASDEAQYLNYLGHRLGRSPSSAGLIMGFFLLGMVATLRRLLIRERIRRSTFLILLSQLSIFAVIIAAIPLAWQRYSVPLIPGFAIFVGLGLAWGIENSRRLVANGSLMDKLSQILSQFASNSRVS